MGHTIQLTARPKTSIRQILGTRLANVIKLSEKEFNQLINDIEKDPLFEKLRAEKIVRYKRFPGTDFSGKFLELNENISADHAAVDVVSILETKKEAVETIKKIGMEKFKEYFLHNEENLPNDEIAQRCEISAGESKKVIDLLNEVSIHSEFSSPPGFDIASQARHSRIAKFEEDGEGGFIINFHSPNLARGKYEIEYGKLAGVKDKKLKTFIRSLELINTRKNALYQILNKLLECQKEFLSSGSLEKRKPLLQREVAAELKVCPSVICRSIINRSIEIPPGGEIPLRDFFPSKREIRKNLIKDIISDERRFLTDEEVKEKLKKEYDIGISRRSVADSRKELKIASSSKRKLCKGAGRN